MEEKRELSGKGTLRVQVMTANGALPVRDAVVQISETGGGVIRSLRTDESGLTPIVSLPAPPAAESLTPGVQEPYASYQLTVRRDGYYPLEGASMTVFDGIRAVQPVLLLPVSEFGERSPAGLEEHTQILEAPADGAAL